MRTLELHPQSNSIPRLISDYFTKKSASLDKTTEVDVITIHVIMKILRLNMVTCSKGYNSAKTWLSVTLKLYILPHIVSLLYLKICFDWMISVEGEKHAHDFQSLNINRL